MNSSSSSGFKKTLMEKGEEFFKNKNKDLEKIRLFEENNFLKCNTKDYNRLFSHIKTKDFHPRISHSFYQNLENLISSRSDGRGHINYNNLNRNDNHNDEKQDLMLSINNQNNSEKSKDKSNLEKKNLRIKTKIDLQDQNQNQLIREKTWNITIASNEIWGESIKNTSCHRKTKSHELKSIVFFYSKKESLKSFKSSNKYLIDNKNEILKTNIICTKKNTSTNYNANKNKVSNIECFENKKNRASDQEASKFNIYIIINFSDVVNLALSPSNDNISTFSTTIEDGINLKNNYANNYLFCLEKNLINKIVFQKYFFYQLKKNSLIASKYYAFMNINYNDNTNIDENNISTISSEFFSNNFNVNYSKIFSSIKHQSMNNQKITNINDYVIYKDEIIAKYDNEVFYKAKKILNEELYVILTLNV